VAVSDLPPVERLRSAILYCNQIHTRKPEYTVVRDDRRAFVHLIGVLLRVRRFAQASTLLDKRGFGPEARVLVRAAIEHAVTAQYAYLVVGGLDEFISSVASDRISLTELIASHSRSEELSTQAEAFRAERDADLSSGNFTRARLPGFTGENSIVALLDNAAFLVQTYRVLSQDAHVTHSATYNALMQDGDEIVIQLDPPDDIAHQTLYALTSASLLAAWVVAHIEHDDLALRTIRAWGNELHMPWRLDGHLSADRRRFPDETE